jgi:hypothetical protein
MSHDNKTYMQTVLRKTTLPPLRWCTRREKGAALYQQGTARKDERWNEKEERVNAMSDNLKACPFCGGEPHCYQRAEGIIRVTCHTDLCGMNGVYMDADEWNRRTPDTDAVLEALAQHFEDEAQKYGRPILVKEWLEYAAQTCRSKKGTV